MDDVALNPAFQDVAASGNHIRVLIIDDSEIDAQLIVSFLKRERLPISFDLIRTQEELEQHLTNKSYDVILSDHNLQFWTARDALEIVRKLGKDIPFIVVTGALGEERAVEYLKTGASDFVLKERLNRLPLSILRTMAEKHQREVNSKLQQKIRQSNEAWERTFEAIPDSIMLLDRERRILRANAATSLLVGLPMSEIIGKQCLTLVHGCGRVPDDCPLERTLRTGEQAEVEIAEFGARKIFRTGTFPLRNAAGEIEGAVHVMRDITERKELEQAVIQSQKLEAIGRLSGGIAHDFNNILGVIQGYAELLESELPQSQEAMRQQLSEIKKAAQRAAGVTRQLLAFSRKQVMQLTALKLGDVVADVATMLRRLIGENIELQIKTAGELAWVKADPVQMQQVLINLAINARDAMPNGGRLSICTSNVELDSHYPRIHDPVKPGKYVMLSVTDTGVGMHEETLKNIFEPFFTTKQGEKGTGFGLSIVYGIIKQSGGYIWVYSEPDRGTTFKVYLPQIESGREIVSIATSLPSTSVHQSATILVVEDERAVAAIVSTVLKKAGYTVLCASTGEDGLEIARMHKAKIDLLLSDVVLRGTIDGLELAANFCALRPESRVLFMSGYSDALNRAGGECKFPLLEKPFTNAELCARIQTVLEEQSPPAVRLA